MDSVSLLNLWCQKNNKEYPTYTYSKLGSKWSAIVTAPWFEEYFDIDVFQGDSFKTKKIAKQNISEIVYNMLKENKHLEPCLKLLVMIDGDQRSDVIKWLDSEEITWSDNLEFCIYASPISNIKFSKPLKIKYSKTTNRDSADALLLMDLGVILYTDPNKHIVIVSSDHMLCQAAEDNGLVWAKDLEGLKRILCF